MKYWKMMNDWLAIRANQVFSTMSFFWFCLFITLIPLKFPVTMPFLQYLSSGILQLPPPYEFAHIGPAQIVLFTSTNPHWLEGTTELQALHFDTDLTEQEKLECAFIDMMEASLKESNKAAQILD